MPADVLLLASCCAVKETAIDVAFNVGPCLCAGAGKEARVVPADVLLLAGSCIVEEAVLTGESTPQWKTPVGTHSAKGAASEGADVAQVQAPACLCIKELPLSTGMQQLVTGETPLM